VNVGVLVEMMLGGWHAVCPINTPYDTTSGCEGREEESCLKTCRVAAVASRSGNGEGTKERRKYAVEEAPLAPLLI
jgi:hypothetical protein